MKCLTTLAAALAAICGPSVAMATVVADFSPDGRRIAVPWPVAQEACALAIISVDGSGFQVVPDGGDAAFPQWSPDGAHIVFQSTANGKPCAKLYNTKTGRTRMAGSEMSGPFAWREDGKRFACNHRREDGSLEVVFYNVPELGVTFRSDVPFQSVGDAQICWIATTDDIAVIGRDGEASNVYLIESGQVQKLTTSNDVIGLMAATDGGRLVWARRSANPRYILASFYEFDMGTRSVKRLAFPDRIVAVNPSPRNAPSAVGAVTFSPAGNRVSITMTYAGANPKSASQTVRLYSMTLAGGGVRLARQRTVAVGQAVSLQADWSNTGQDLAVVDDGPDTTLVLVNPVTGASRALLSSRTP